MFFFLHNPNKASPISDMFAPVSRSAAIGAPSTFTVMRDSTHLGVYSTLHTAGMSTAGVPGSGGVVAQDVWRGSLGVRPSRAAVLGGENFVPPLSPVIVSELGRPAFNVNGTALVVQCKGGRAGV